MEDIRSFDASFFSQLSEPPMAHVSAVIGHYIIFIGGYRICYENDIRTLTTFNKHHFLYYNILSHQLNVLECDYDMESLGNFPSDFFCASGMAATCVGTRIYLFGGYSLIRQDSGNSLYYIELSRDAQPDRSINIHESLQSKPTAMLKFLCGSCDEMPESIHNQFPSYRDKCSIVHWSNRLFVFGGYGINFRRQTELGSVDDTSDEYGHEFLAEHGDYIAGSGNRGWNNQLLVYRLNEGGWKNPRTGGNVPCPRAAHSAAISGYRMIVFGGRLGLQNTAATIRSNQCFYLDLLTLDWTEVTSVGDRLIGRSWSTLTAVSLTEFLVVGGFSGDNVPLGDASLLRVDFDNGTARVTNQVNCMHQAQWDPYMDHNSWNMSQSPQSPVSRMWHSANWAPDGNVYVFGGCQNNLIFQVEKIQTLVERVRPVPATLYQLSLWSLVRHFYFLSHRRHLEHASLHRISLPDRVFLDVGRLCS